MDQVTPDESASLGIPTLQLRLENDHLLALPSPGTGEPFELPPLS